MRSSTWRKCGLGVCAAVLGVCGLAACGGDDSTVTIGPGSDGGPDGTPGVDAAPQGDAAGSDASPGSDGATDGGTDAPPGACDGPTAGAVYVDPMNGSDATNGSGKSGGAVAGRCAFKTITHAIAAVGAPTAATFIHVLPTATASAGETFPLVVPANVTIDAVGAPATIALPAAAQTNAITLKNASSGLMGLVLDGSAAAQSKQGVLVQSGATATLDHVEVKGFGDAGVRAEGTAMLTLKAGTKLHDNGTSGGVKAGLHATGSANVTASAASGADPILFMHNAGEGVLVDGTAQVAFTGAPGTGGAGTIAATDNGTAGIAIAQDPTALTRPVCTLTGVVLWHNTGSGAHFFGGSTVTLRGSYVLDNAENGVLVSDNPAQSLSSTSVTGIDLGTGHDGMNVLQAATNPNGAAGICLEVTATLGATLNAQGNTFHGNDCSQAASASVTLNKNNCVAGANSDVGLRGSQQNAISTAYCTN